MGEDGTDLALETVELGDVDGNGNGSNGNNNDGNDPPHDGNNSNSDKQTVARGGSPPLKSTSSSGYKDEVVGRNGTNKANGDKEDEGEGDGKDGKKKEGEKAERVGVYKLLFTYATGYDVLLMFIGTLAAIATG